VTLSRVPGSPPPRAHASVQVTDEQRQPEELPASPLPPEGGDAGWRIAQVSPMP
jgi:hypothetical protein